MSVDHKNLETKEGLLTTEEFKAELAKEGKSPDQIKAILAHADELDPNGKPFWGRDWVSSLAPSKNTNLLFRAGMPVLGPKGEPITFNDFKRLAKKQNPIPRELNGEFYSGRAKASEAIWKRRDLWTPLKACIDRTAKPASRLGRAMIITILPFSLAEFYIDQKKQKKVLNMRTMAPDWIQASQEYRVAVNAEPLKAFEKQLDLGDSPKEAFAKSFTFQPSSSKNKYLAKLLENENIPEAQRARLEALMDK